MKISIQISSAAPLAIKLLLAALLLTACNSAPGESSAASSDSEYSQGRATSGGTGRYYMGREIAGVMGYQGAGWLERAERQEEERTELTVANLPLQDDYSVADIGAGSGYFSRRIAARIPRGTLYAVDIQPEMLAILERNAADSNLSNIQTVLAAEQSLNLTANTIDLALFVDVYHELAWPREIIQDLKTALKPGGKIVLVEYRAEDPSIPIIPVHKMTEQQALRELERAGFEYLGNEDFLPRQHFLVFRKPEAP